MAKYLVIVESPAKSKTIEKYLGDDFTVKSSKGHIRDLTKSGFGGYGVDIENNFEPKYRVQTDKKLIVKELKVESKKAEKVYLATDPDREGEAISWHLFEVLGLNNDNYERIVFNEITKKAVVNSLENGREIDMDLVKSQEARRILDRIIGFSLSKLLQNKIGSKSAGRVQSAALKLIVDKEKEHQAFIPEEYWEVYGTFTHSKKEIKAKLISFNDEKIELKSREDTDNVLKELNDKYIVESITAKERQKQSRAPFITSTLQQDASSKFNYSSKKTMMVAQKLYEGIEVAKERVGLITYMRTDSKRLSDDFIEDGKKYIIDNYGENYYKGYKEAVKKDKNVQDAHEAIRPTNLEYNPKEIKKYLSADEYKLYSLIYFRALATLMSNAVAEDGKITIANNGYKFEANGSKIIFDGYLKVYGQFETTSDNELPSFKEKDEIKQYIIEEEQKFTSPPARYTEAKLIKKMEELGIGRPSTYSTVVDTLKKRFYIQTEQKSFIPTDQGILTSDKLNEYFSNIINVKYTAEMEETLDEISNGEKVSYEELDKFYQSYKPILDEAQEKMEKIYPKFLDELCPECSLPLVVRRSRYGEFIACSGFPKCRYIKQEEKDIPIDTGIICPECNEGTLLERIGRRGRAKDKTFYGCSRYPKCKATFSELPEEK
ncbi:MAG TPA: type I DNA topoisomerase [Acholeplasmataceae bacterium]|nr:type I DNA topoisomerase [Acholeplasmataceae bacterium]